MFTTRPATLADHAALAQVGQALGYSTAGAGTHARLQALLDRPDHAVFLAEGDGRVVGWVHVFAAYRLASASFAELGGLVVDPAYRTRGVGRALVERAGAWAREQGLPRLRVRVNVQREGAHAFYERLGFQDTKTQRVYQQPL